MADHPTSPLRVRQIARDLGTSPTTVHRILRIFEQFDFVGRSDEGEYQSGLELYRICTAIASEISPVNIAHPYVAKLAESCGESTLFAMYDRKRGQMMFMDKVEAAHPLRYVVELNRWMPIHAGATGLAILAHLPQDERRRAYHAGLDALTPQTKVTERALEAEVETVRARGYAHSHGQRMAGAVGFAAPVFDSAGQVAGDLCITLPQQRYEGDTTVAVLVGPLTETAKQITDRFKAAGYVAAPPGRVKREEDEIEG